MRKAMFSVLLPAASLVLSAAATAQEAPLLRYTPPPNAFRQAVSTPEDYAFNGFNASVQFYPFRPFDGDIQKLFQWTLLRDWVSPMHQEENVGAPPAFRTLAVPGATLALSASFAENIVGLPKPHMRMVVVAGKQAAIVDASAGTMQSWQQAVPYLNAMAAGLRVEAGRAPPPLAQAAGRAVAGLYQGFKAKYMATMVNVTGSGYYTQALHYYLFSPGGRVYRAYDKLEVPGGDPARFDFDAAQRRDPDNSGTYTVDGGKLLIQFGGASSEKIVAPVPKGGTLTIYAVPYKRQ
jgi:hypothetical protein